MALVLNGCKYLGGEYRTLNVESRIMELGYFDIGYSKFGVRYYSF
jgi:hypothetical protein